MFAFAPYFPERLDPGVRGYVEVLALERNSVDAVLSRSPYVRYGEVLSHEEAAMLSPGDIAKIKDEIRRLESALDPCPDSRIRGMITARSDELKQKLASG
jgi:hypothetical protein